MGMGPMAGNKPMLAVFFMHPVQATQFLERFDRPVDGCMTDPHFFQYIGSVGDGIAIGCIVEQLPDRLSLVGETVAQVMKTLFEIRSGICVF